MNIKVVLFTLTTLCTVSATLQYAHKTWNNFVETDKEITELTSCINDECHSHGDCLTCTFPLDCIYGDIVNVNCTSKPLCQNPVSKRVQAKCRFCWQTEESEHSCYTRNCDSASTRPVKAVCTVRPDIICMGKRTFYKNTLCRWKSGYSWFKTMFLSITLGGFGVDRFYLGLWRSGIGKMVSFGGIGIWTLVDIFLIGLGYLGPADGSEYE